MIGLVKNTAAEIAARDEGLSTAPDASHVKASLAIAKKDWKEAKAKLDEMSADELEEFIDSLDGIPLIKTGYVRVRLTPREYAALRKKALENKSNITDVLTGDNLDLT
ncbi:hypothetical protein ACXIVC_21915 [Vibrio parahaemolyticus]|nr:hypothetical protein [Vibrio alginolyticus]